MQDDLRLQRMSTGTEPLQGDTILRSTQDATLTEIDSDIDHDRSVRKSVGLSTKESKFTARQPAMLGFQGMLVDRITPHLPKENEEVNAHVKRL
jgi:hypothetical protein